MKYGIIFLIVALILIGCSASEEQTKQQAPPQQPSATEMMTNVMGDLKKQNDSLNTRLSKLEQDNRVAIAHAAELETQLTEMKEKIAAAVPPPTPKIANTRGQYEHAVELFRSRHYQDAAAELEGVLDAGAPTDLTDNCHYWLGECAYGMKNYKDAIEHFEKVFTFKRSEKKDDAQIMIANSYFAMGNKTQAKAEYQKFLDKFPASPYAKRAKERLGKL